MSSLFSSSFRRAAITGVALAAMAPALASAQEAGAQDGDQVSNDDIVVTGTLIRGAAPVGSNLIAVGEERIASSGAATANELMATVPQVTNLFNTVPTSRLNVSASSFQIVRPNLRSLTNETSSSATTLVLFDGHRISSAGVTQNAVDPDILPPIAIERVEVVTDGGSATYGSDAIGGVINFVTRKRFDGLKVTARYGFADDYHQIDAGAIVGKDWGSGSVFAAYGYQHNDAIFGRDRDFIRQVDWLSPSRTPTGRSCVPGNVQIGSNVFALPALTSRVPNACDITDDNSVVPVSTRHSALVGLRQELADWLTVDLRGFYGERTSTAFSPAGGGRTGSVTVTPAQFYYRPVPGQSATANETVLFSFQPLLGTNTFTSGSKIQEWGANAEFEAKLTDNWRLRTLFNYSRSNSTYHLQQFNSTLLNSFGRGTTQTTAINFYNPSAADLPLIRQVIDSENAGQAKEELFNLRWIIDGSLFTLPGGDVKLAFGYEHMADNFQQRVAPTDRPIGAIRSVGYVPYGRTVDSGFGELQVPVVGADNAMGFLYSLTLAASVRYDRYSDFGHTTNPKFGFTLKPVRWLGIRGNYSTSFNAPSPNDQLGSLRNTSSFFAFNAFTRPGDTPTVSGTVALTGSNPGLQPQTAKTYSFGVDIDPPFIEGLHASANYYNVKFKNIITIPTPGTGIFANFPNNVTTAPNGLTLTQISNFLNNSGAPNAAATLASVQGRCNSAGICNVYELVEFRQGNYGSLKVQGIDFSANYRATTGFGGVDAGVSGNYQLSRKTQTGIGAPVIDQLRTTNRVLPNGQRLVNDAQSRLQLQATLGADIGAFRAQATINHNAGYRIVRCDPTTTPACNPSATGVPTASGKLQDRVGSFDTVNLFFRYAVPSESYAFKDLELTLNINNVFDTDPPIYRSVIDPGYANGFTLGRMVQVGLSKKF